MDKYAGSAVIGPLCEAASACWGERAALHPGNVWWSASPHHGRVQDWRAAVWSDDMGPVAAAWLEGPARATVIAAHGHPQREKLLKTAARWAVKHGDRRALTADVLDDDRSLVAAWEDAGLRPRQTPAFFQRDTRALTDLGDPAPYPGYRVRPMGSSAIELAERVELHVAAWTTTVHRSAFDLDSYAMLRRSPYYRPELDVVVEGPDRRLHASALIWWDEMTGVGLVEPVGVRPEKRRMGLGRAAVLGGLWALRALGGREAVVWPRGDHEHRWSARMCAALGFTIGSHTIPYGRR